MKQLFQNKSLIARLWAEEVRDIDAKQKLVLIMLAGRVGKRNFDVFPSHRWLADRCCMSVSSVRRALEGLAAGDMPLISVSSDFGDKGQTSNIYTLNIHHGIDWNELAKKSDVDSHEDDEIRAFRPPVQDEHPPSKMNRGPVHSYEQGGCSLVNREGTSQGTSQENQSDSPIIPKEDVDLFGHPIEIAGMSDEEIADAFVERWNTLAAEVPAISSITRLGEKRKTSLLARIDDYEPKRERARVVELIDRVVNTIRGSRFLRDQHPTKRFKASADWALTPTYFPKLEETGYAQDAAPGADQSAARGGRSHVATGQAVAELLDARRGSARPSARQLAGLPPKRTADAR